MTKAEQARATVARIIRIARRQFSEHGYAQTGTEELVRLAGLTRGALYHHFAGKKGLFEAVFEDALREIAEQILQAVESEKDLWRGFTAGCRAFLTAAADPTLQRIVIIDAPAVLGWRRWRELDARNGSQLLREGLEELAAAGLLPELSLDALASLLIGAMNESALWIAEAPDPQAALAEAQRTMEILLEGLRV